MNIMVDFSILIATMHSRRVTFEQVLKEINKQVSELPSEVTAEVLYEVDNGELTLGAKRNILVDRAQGKYHCFIDDDDVIAPFFLKTFIPMLKDDYDCASYVGAFYYMGSYVKPFYHSLDNKEWSETPDVFLRSVSPMNMIKTDIVRKVRYKDIRYTEDHEFSIRLTQSGLLKSEYKIPFIPVYHYIAGTKENRNEWEYSWTDETNTRLTLHNKGYRTQKRPVFTWNLPMR